MLRARAASPIGGKYDTLIDRESAAEILAKKANAKAEQAQAPQAQTPAQDQTDNSHGFGDAVKDALFGTKRRQGMIESMAKQTARTVGSQVGRQILRGLLGGMFGGKR